MVNGERYPKDKTCIFELLLNTIRDQPGLQADRSKFNPNNNRSNARMLCKGSDSDNSKPFRLRLCLQDAMTCC
jgi:hypothetical protein